MSKTPLKKIIKSKIKSNKELSEAEILREKIKFYIFSRKKGLKLIIIKFQAFKNYLFFIF